MVYFAASIWPFMGTFIYALDAESGKVRWINDATGADYIKQPHGAPAFAGVAPQGQLAATADAAPGARRALAVPAAFDRRTGASCCYFHFGGKGEGGSFVAADESRVFVHTRVRGTMALQPGRRQRREACAINEPVLAEGVAYAANTPGEKDGQGRPGGHSGLRRRQAAPVAGRGRRQRRPDQGGRPALCGRRGSRSWPSIRRRAIAPARIAWSLPVEGQVPRLLAADDMLFAVTLDGRIMAFGRRRARQAQWRRRRRLPSTRRPRPTAEPNELLAADRRPRGLRAVVRGRRRAAAGGRACSPPSCTSWSSIPTPTASPRSAAASTTPACTAVAWSCTRPTRFLRPSRLHGQPDGRRPPFGRTAARAAVSLRAATNRCGPTAASCGVPAQGDAAGARKVLRSADLAKAAITPDETRLDRHPRGLAARRRRLDPRLRRHRQHGQVERSAREAPAGPALVRRQFQSRRAAAPRTRSQRAGGRRAVVHRRHELPQRPRRVHRPRAVEPRISRTSAPSTSTTTTPTPRRRSAPPTTRCTSPEPMSAAPTSWPRRRACTWSIGSRCLLLDAATGQTLREFVLPATDGAAAPLWGFVGVYQDLLLAGTGFGNYRPAPRATSTKPASRSAASPGARTTAAASV